MNNSKPQFEKIEHRVYSGELQRVPLLIDKEHGLMPESNTLLEAASIIGANLHLYEGGVSNLVEKVGKILSNPLDKKGLIIEDEDGVGSISVDPEKTSVKVWDKGSWDVPTELFFDMLYVWSTDSGSATTQQ